MGIFFQNSFLEINPYLRKSLMIFKEALGFIIFIFALTSLISFSNYFLKGVAFFLLIFFIVSFFRRNSSKEDLRELPKYQKEKINLDDYLTKKTKKILVEIITKAEILKVKNQQIFLLKELLKFSEIKNIISRLEIDFKDFNREIYKFNSQTESKDILSILISAFNLAIQLNYLNINLLFIFYGLREVTEKELKELFAKFNFKKEYLLTAILMENYSSNLKFKISKPKQFSVFHYKISRRDFLNKALTSKPTPLLDSYSTDLTYLANRQNLGFLVGHKEELEKTIENLRQGNNVLLIGDEGTGKETTVINLAWRLQNDLVPKELLDYRLVKLDLGLVYAQNKENFLPLMSQLINEILYSGYIILFLPYLENILLEKNVDVMQVLHEVLISKRIPIIASMTNIGYQKSQTRYNLSEYFEKIEMKELTLEEGIFLLTLKSLIWEKQEKIVISPQSIVIACDLAKKFIKDKTFPKSAEEVLREAINLAKKNNQKYLNHEFVQEIVSEKAKIPSLPVEKLSEQEKEKLLNLENLLHQKIIDQEEGIRQIARVLKIYHAGLEKKKGPIGSFLFVGPTGVGKTETAKALAQIYYGSENLMLRLDMVEFQNSEDIEKLIGSPDGSLIGRLTEPVRQNPYILILLDEFEKTHPNILRLFLPIFDEGIIKDALGREVDFRNSLIICTSNAYSEFIKESLEKGEDFDKITNELKSKLTTIFSIELINRFDAVVVYKPLKEPELLKIAQLMINELRNDILLKHGIDLELSERALKEIVHLGTDPIYGARPLKRKIEEIIKNEIANLILAERVSRGNKIFVDFDNIFKFIIK
jgi:ATP-dependent Clp protease ATP-binding subunit ClpC